MHAAWGAVVTRGGNEHSARDYLHALLEHTVRLDPGARRAAGTFTVEKRGDVQLAWENDALREVGDNATDLEVVYPPVSNLAEPYVAWVDANVARHHTAREAQPYLSFLFSDDALRIIAQPGYRPYDPRFAASSAPLTLFPVTAIARDWDDANHRFFDENGILDSVSRSASIATKGSRS